MINAPVSGAFRAVAKALKFRPAGEVQPTSERWAAWAQVGILPKLGAMVAIAGLLLAAGRHRIPGPAPLVVTHTISLAEFGVHVLLPSPWNVKQGHSGMGFAAAHPETGALLVGAVTVSDPPSADLDTILNRIIERQRAQSGKVENISRGVMSFGLLDARWVKFSFLRNGEMVRARTVALQRGPKTLTLTCTGGASAQESCNSAVSSMTMAR